MENLSGRTYPISFALYLVVQYPGTWPPYLEDGIKEWIMIGSHSAKQKGLSSNLGNIIEETDTHKKSFINI